MTTLKATFGHLRNISSVPLVYETNPIILNIATRDQRLQWFAAAMVNNYEHDIRIIDLHVHPITKFWRNHVQWMECFWSFLS